VNYYYLVYVLLQSAVASKIAKLLLVGETSLVAVRQVLAMIDPLSPRLMLMLMRCNPVVHFYSSKTQNVRALPLVLRMPDTKETTPKAQIHVLKQARGLH
jgi:hypothetical protein